MVTIISYLFLALFTTIDNNRNADTINQISRYLKLAIELDKDTVSFGDELTVTVVFKNKTDFCQTFYPKALIYITKSYGIFVSSSLFLHKAVDLRLPEKIDPYGTYKDTYKVWIDPSFFREGENNLYLHYLCSTIKEKKLKEYIKLYGPMYIGFKLFVTK